MRDRTLIGPWIRRFLLEHLVSDRNLTRNTQASYRDTLLLLLPFVSQAQKKPTDRLMIDDLSPSRLRSFLEYLEKERGCSGATRNLRLAAIHSLAKFIGMRSPEHVAWSTEIRAVPFKKTPKSSLTYLDKPEIDALLKAPDLRTPQGSRDYALLLFLYNTGARVEEAAHLTIDDHHLEQLSRGASGWQRQQDSLLPHLEAHRRYAQTACRWTQHPGVRLSQPPQ